MIRHGRQFSLRSSIAFAFMVVASGCSLEAPKSPSLQVQIVDNNAPRSQFKLFATPSSIGDLNCFAINVREGAIGGNPASCNGFIKTGIVSHSVASRPAAISVDVPAGNATTIEAYGFQAATCPGLGEVITNGVIGDSVYNGKIYKLGQATVDIADSVAVTIVANFDSNLGFQCTTPAPFTTARITAGANTSCGLSREGLVYCWGMASSGQLGNNNSVDSSSPVAVTGTTGTGTLSQVTAIAAGTSHVCAKNSAGTAYCWGQNTNGQLGNGATVPNLYPAQVSTVSSVTSIAAGGATSCASIGSGGVYCWGSNTNGQVGNNTTTGAPVAPTQVVGVGGAGNLSNVTAVVAGADYGCARDSSAAVFCWGANLNGQLGNNTSTPSNSPVQVVGVGGAGNLTSITAIAAAAGSMHSCALDSSGNVFCWGYNNNKQLGDGTTNVTMAPVQVLGVGGAGNLASITSIAVGTNHSCAVSAAGDMYCWGLNVNGQLGIGTTAPQTYPVQVTGVSGVVTPAVGATHSCALTSSGATYCWGAGASGGLGNGATVNSSSPVQVLGVGATGNLSL